MIEIRFTNYFEKWLLKLKDKKAIVAVRSRVDLIQSGDFGDCKDVGEKVKELRIHYGPGYRVYFTKQGDRIVILLLGGDKGSQARDIEKAKKIAKELKK